MVWKCVLFVVTVFDVADGSFSTAGPCGGAKTFGSNGVTNVNEGDEIELNIA